MSNWFKRNGIHLIIAGIFIAICSVYFSPALQGKILPQGDVQQAQFMAKEIMEFKKDGRGPLWTNSMFGGMPSYQIWVQYPYNITTYIISFFTHFFPNPIGIVLLLMLGAYFLFCVLRANPWLASAGAVAVSFTTYNFVMIEAGHNNQALAISFFAPILAGILLTLRKNYLAGASVTAFFLALEIRSNHVQMSYYLFISLLILMGIELYHAIKSKQTNDFLKTLAWLAGATLLAVAVNAGTLWTTYEYSKESIRGKSNLVTDKAQPSDGVDRAYAYNWSQGVGESMTFLIPGAYGGASSSHLEENSNVVKVLTDHGVPADQATAFAQQTSTYWGEKPGTAGPNYFGAIICFLFVLGLFLVDDRMKWWILSASLLSLLLSFGKNLPFISDLFFNYFPLYNKFRTVESNLAITQFLFPILAILAVKEVAFHKQDPKTLLKKFSYALYITGGILLIVIAIPSLFFTFKASTHDQFIQQLMQGTGGDRGFADAIANALVQDRAGIARADAIRSLLFVLAGAGLMWLLIKQKIKAEYAFILLAMAVLIDMWGIDRRFVKTEQFMDKSSMAEQAKPRQVDQLIMRDTNLSYRVLDLTTNPFIDARPSNFHKNIGGYHAAKLKRYQEVIDKQFTNSLNQDVLDMLNTKYLISTDPKGESQQIQNRSTAAGNAWFVPQVIYVKNAEQEMNAISSFDPKKVAYVNEEFRPLIDNKKLGFDETTSSIKLTDYNPDHMTYEYTAGHDVLAVFSEIWYDKGWNAYVDGVKIPYFRANYILRAAQLPGGNHKFEFKFEPTSYYTGEKISLIASILLLAGLGFVIYTETRKKPAA